MKKLATIVMCLFCGVAIAAPAPGLTNIQVTKIVSSIVPAGETITD